MQRLLVLALFPFVLVAETPYERMLASQEMVREYLIRKASEITQHAATEIESREAWEAVREARQREMRRMLGLDPWPDRTPLRVEITGKIERPGYTIERLAYQSLPGVYATANLYVPTEREGPLPTVVYVNGHAYNEHGNKASYQRHAHTFAKHGYVCLIIDSIQIAETFALHHGALNNEMYDWYARGYSPAGVEVWNVVRGLDYLETRPEVDAERFGITGRSGGAAMSWFSASVDERIKVVMPVMGISTYAANVRDNTQRRHCDCMFPVNGAMHDMMHQGALIAPRPLLMAHGKKDLLFPVAGYEEFEQRVGELYESYGVRERFDNVVVDTGHEDSDFLRTKSLEWFDRWLKGVPQRDIDVSFEAVPDAELSVYRGEPPADAQNFRVHEFFGPTEPNVEIDNAAQWARRREELMGGLKEEVFASLPPIALPGYTREGEREAPNGFAAFVIRTDAGIEVDALFRRADEKNAPALLWIASDGEDARATQDTLRQVWWNDDYSVMVVYPRGVGEVPWPKTVWKDMQRNAMHVGHTVDSMRLWDVLVAARLLRERANTTKLTIGGQGIAAGLAIYAGALDDRVTQVMVVDPPQSQVRGPYFLNVLRHTDLPEAAALLAPRPLYFYGRMPEAYSQTQGIYSTLEQAQQFRRTMSVKAVMDGKIELDFASGL